MQIVFILKFNHDIEISHALLFEKAVNTHCKAKKILGTTKLLNTDTKINIICIDQKNFLSNQFLISLRFPTSEYSVKG